MKPLVATLVIADSFFLTGACWFVFIDGRMVNAKATNRKKRLLHLKTTWMNCWYQGNLLRFRTLGMISSWIAFQVTADQWLDTIDLVFDVRSLQCVLDFLVFCVFVCLPVCLIHKFRHNFAVTSGPKWSWKLARSRTYASCCSRNHGDSFVSESWL